MKSLWDSGRARNAVFLADYAINPLGVKSDAAIADVVGSWLARAAQVSDTLIIACNTLSIRYHQLFDPGVPHAGLEYVVSMVDCFTAMVTAEADRMRGKRVLIIGTAFTASQNLYADILSELAPDVRVATVSATELERKIARFEPPNGRTDSSFTPGLRVALEDADIAVLACTCFPMVRAELDALFPDVLFLDPGAYCVSLVPEVDAGEGKQLLIEISGREVTEGRVIEYARAYLGVGSVDSFRS